MSAPDVIRPGVRLADLTWAEAAARFRAGDVVVLPVGAAAKEHGPHLPLDTDARTAEALAEAVATALPVVVAPLVGYGFYPAFRDWPGSTHLRAETFQAAVTDVSESLARHGVRRIAVINTGVSTEPPLQLVARHMRERHDVKMAIADIRSLGHDANQVLENPTGGHADERETSVMLALAPETVQVDLAVAEPPGAARQGVFHWPVSLRPNIPPGDAFGERDLSASGATGDPTAASPEKGRRILAAMAVDLVDGLRAAFPDSFH